MPGVVDRLLCLRGEIDDLAVALRVERQLLIPCLHDPPVARARPAPVPGAQDRLILRTAPGAGTSGPGEGAAMSDPVVPPLPEALLAPLLDAAGEVSRVLDLEDGPGPAAPAPRLSRPGPGARRGPSAAADARWRPTRPSASAWSTRFSTSPRCGRRSKGGAPRRRRNGSTMRPRDRTCRCSRRRSSRRARRAGCTGLGLADATFERSRHVHEADAALQALEQRLAQADEARRRADDAKTSRRGASA